MEKYSVLMSLYAKEKPEYLVQAVESMLAQTAKPDEIVIVKDGPLPKGLEKVLEEYSNHFPELFNLVVSEKNIGLGLALNLGLRNCRNEFVARMDTDDISMPERCSKQLEAFRREPGMDILGGNISEFIDDMDNVVGRRVVPSGDAEIKAYMKKRCPFNHMTVMFKKSEVLKAGNYCDWFWNEDYYLWIRMFEAGCMFGNLSEVLVNVRVGQDMYRRRGGLKYFKSEAALQGYLLEKRVISTGEYIYNVAIRLIVQVLIPSGIRGSLFRKFARSDSSQ